ncbi:Interleukin-18-binding protein [Tupaia chinensis]|uniref:Interleukin-18-binding protein n=1 Tax=Tupaia chinensis TaxID=246437 RepID=L9LA46_TUPCH|nr:Interleukin-18-binding protein [Tupaia chinensis]
MSRTSSGCGDDSASVTDGRINLSCTACSHFPHFSILYWLGNGSFIEHLPGRLWEGAIRREHRSTSTQLWRALVLEELSPALRSTNFSCVFVDPEQVAQHHGVLAQLWAQPRTILFPTQEALPSRASPGPQLPTTAGLGTSRGPAQHDPDLEGQ